jgi:hypothetical protein
MQSDLKGQKNAYAPPLLRKLNPEQATLLLVGHAWNGDQNARDLLELCFPEPGEEKRGLARGCTTIS